mmetsp:Transcript_12094/g.38647  ORF Transcript_12094/g.38647 Transcript_12094/m.38647 type:complete len:185 (+) Transcript_12094:59-613(+)
MKLIVLVASLALAVSVCDARLASKKATPAHDNKPKPIVPEEIANKPPHTMHKQRIVPTYHRQMVYPAHAMVAPEIAAAAYAADAYDAIHQTHRPIGFHAPYVQHPVGIPHVVVTHPWYAHPAFHHGYYNPYGHVYHGLHHQHAMAQAAMRRYAAAAASPYTFNGPMAAMPVTAEEALSQKAARS